MKKYIKILLIFVIIIALFFGVYYSYKIHYKYIVEQDFSIELISKVSKPELTQNILLTKDEKDTNPSMLKWDNALVRSVLKTIESRTTNGAIDLSEKKVIEVSKDDAQNWSVIAESENNLCNSGVLYKSNLYCIAWNADEIKLNLISIDGIKKTKTLVSSLGVSNVKIILNESNDIILLWVDDRAKFPTAYAFLPIANSELPYKGADLVIAGELNLDTLEFKEHVVKYNSDIWP